MSKPHLSFGHGFFVVVVVVLVVVVGAVVVGVVVAAVVGVAVVLVVSYSRHSSVTVANKYTNVYTYI